VALDREQILKAAVDLMDEVGLAGLSLRRLAKQLGVAAPALYWHFQNKQELLDQMAEQMFIGEVPAAGPPGDGESWEDWLVTRARQTRAALLRHRDAAMLAASTKPRGSQWDQIELQEQADRVRDASGSGPDGDVHTPEEISAWVLQQGDYPLLAEALAAGGDPQGDAVFEYGLRLLIDGMRERLRRSA
jgi:TetR/AcrR family transcriptional regulator, tetracycline repressor protein